MQNIDIYELEDIYKRKKGYYQKLRIFLELYNFFCFYFINFIKSNILKYIIFINYIIILLLYLKDFLYK